MSFGITSILKLHALYDKVWRHMRDALETLQGREASIDTYFEVHSVVNDDISFIWEGWKFDLVQTLHVVSDRKFMDSYGLIVYKHKGLSKVTFISTDTTFSHPAPLQCFYDKADLIFHDCEVGPFKSGVHAKDTDMLAVLDAETLGKMVWYHNRGKNPDAEGRIKGWAEPGQIFEL